jgi:hypothetical protein
MQHAHFAIRGCVSANREPSLYACRYVEQNSGTSVNHYGCSRRARDCTRCVYTGTCACVCTKKPMFIGNTPIE